MAYTSPEQLNHIGYALDLEQLSLFGIDLEEVYKCSNFGRKYGDVSAIYKAAVSRGILPELLVDESYYYRRKGIVPYRLAFAALRKWPKLSDFYRELTLCIDDYSGRPYYRYPSVNSFVKLLQGDVWWLRDIRLWVILRACKLADIEMGQLFIPYRYRLSRSGEGVFGNLHSVVSGLDNVDVAALVGIARMMIEEQELDEEKVLEVVRWRNSKKGERTDNRLRGEDFQEAGGVQCQ